MAGRQPSAQADFEARGRKAKLPLRAWLRLFASSTLIEREISTRLKSRFGVSLARFDYLAQLYRTPGQGMTMGELGRRLMVTGGSITGLTDRLEAGGLVARNPNPEDRRSHLIELTDKGALAFAEMAAAHEDWIQEIFSNATERQLDALMNGLDAVKDGVRQVSESRRNGGREGG